MSNRSLARRVTVLAAAMLLVLVGTASPARSQQVTVGVPQQVVSDSFYERYGIHWGFRQSWGGGGGVFFDNGGFGGVAPAFGGFDPNAGARLGFGATGNQGGLYFGFAADQGSNRSMTTTAPIITLPQGGIGSIQSGSISPFVTGIVPVVGDGSPMIRSSPLAERLQRIQSGERPGPRGQETTARAVRASDADSPSEAAPNAGPRPPATTSTAERGELSVKEIRRRQADADRLEREQSTAKLAVLVAQGEAAEAKGRFGVARSYYQQAQPLASGDEARELAARIRRLAK